MKYSITGSNLQIANVEIGSGEELVTNAGSMVYMSGNVQMESKMEGGFMSGLKRSFSGSSMFLVKFRTTSGSGTTGSGLPGSGSTQWRGSACKLPGNRS